MVDALLRLHINGPHPKNFDSLKYANLWVKSRYHTDLPKGGAGAEENPAEEEGEVAGEDDDDVTLLDVTEVDVPIPEFNAPLDYEDVPPIF